MPKFITYSFVLLFLWHLNAFGQATVSGIVAGENGEPLPGVTVLVKNTTNGTITDADGNYKLSINAKDPVLVFSFVGYEKQEIPVGNRSIIDVTLQEGFQSLDEVVVIAYGETEKRKFTGSLTNIEAEDIAQIPQASPIQMMQGRSAGVLVEDGNGQPGSTGSMIIRGVGTLQTGSSSQDPLYVIDGTPTTSMSSLNPNDIASISILKDASATSIYGSRAANGVVLITTKKGSVGGTKFTFNAQYGFSGIENPNGFRMMNSTEYKDYYRESYMMAGENPDDPSSGFYMPVNADSINTNWVDDVTRTGKTQMYELTMSHGTEKSKIFSSVSYFDQKGVVIGTDFERFTGRINYSLAPVSKFQIDMNVLGAYTTEDLEFNQGGASGIFSGAFNIAPTASPFASASTPDVLSGLGYNFNLPSNANHNPVASDAMNFNESNQIRLFPTIRLTYDPIENFTLASTASVDYRVRERNLYQSKFYLAETDNGRAELENEVITDANFNVTARYDLDINTDHQLTPLIGFETFRSNYTNHESESRDFAFDGVNNVAFGGVPLSRDYDYNSNTLVSFFGRINYAFQSKLFVDATFRRDGSSRFGPENRWGNFYAFGAGYDLMGESFLQTQSLLSTLKLRASYGIQGNNAIGDFSWRNSYGSGGQFIVPPTGGGTGVPNAGAQPDTPGNTNLKWEQSESFNLGIDFGILNNRVMGTVEYYQRSSLDLLAPRLISQTSGFSEIIDNIGNVRNTGLEISLNSQNINTGSFSWNTGFNITFNTNEIIELNGATDSLFRDDRLIRIAGQPLDQWYLPQYAGVDPGTGLPVYYNQEGGLTFDINGAERMISGQSSTTPDFFGALSNSLSYKGLNLSFMFYFKYGYEVYRENLQSLSLPAGNNQTALSLSRWQQPGDVTSVPRADDFGAQFDANRWLEDGSYIRLRNISLSYLLPQIASEKLGMTDINVSLRGVNVLTFTNFNGFSPDVGLYEEDDDYPINRTITLGITGNF
jgi:TonB-linked SusC/RagA family outer membrane protein